MDLTKGRRHRGGRLMGIKVDFSITPIAVRTERAKEQLDWLRHCSVELNEVGHNKRVDHRGKVERARVELAKVEHQEVGLGGRAKIKSGEVEQHKDRCTGTGRARLVGTTSYEKKAYCAPFCTFYRQQRKGLGASDSGNRVADTRSLSTTSVAHWSPPPSSGRTATPESEVYDCSLKIEVEKIKSAIGFRHVIDLLSSERKLIVGHNCFLDLVHVYGKFVGPLPLTAQDFVLAVRAYFPHIIDTKVMLNLDDGLSRIMKNGRTSLSKAFSLLCPPIAQDGTSTNLNDKLRVRVEVEVDGQRFLNWNSGSKHEAGYDAFMTGCVFSQACSNLGVDFNSHDFPQNEKLRKYVNHLYLSWVNGDLIDLTTGKVATKTLVASKAKCNNFVFSNMILLWGLLPTLRANDIRAILNKVFGSTSIKTIYHLDETAAFVEFSKAEFVSEFHKLKDKLEMGKDPISILHPLSRILEGGRVRAVNYEMYKEICGSPLSEMAFSDQAEAVRFINRRKELVDAAIEVRM
ncbi:Poly(A)-specific ribonuclease PARN [Striga hermonthica]|uniref:Poly(A)-specific ribonuclease PARN n=1 Tax=Striga hermonthica TaxID=68872 RepID=A0A9N7MHY6_STRHE|nr:Poly(A)-specific ribonuclease PARN [Striga hermonthica]